MNNNKKALKSSVWYIASNFLVKGIGIISTPIFTRLLSKSEFGQYNNYISWQGIIAIFVTLNLESTLISAKYDYEDSFDEYIFSVLTLSSISSLIWIIIFFVFRTKITSFMRVDYIYICIMMLYFLFIPTIQLFQARERYIFEYKKTALSSIFLTFSTTIVSIILVCNFKNRLLGRIVGAVVPIVVMGILFYVFFWMKGRHVNVSYWKYAIPICLPYIPHLLAGSVLNSMDRVMIERFCGSEQTAVYSLAYTCGTIVSLLIAALNAAYGPWLGEKLHRNELSDIRAFSKKYILGFFYLTFGIMLISPEILYVMGGPQYMEAKYVIAPVAMGCACQFLYTMYVNIEQFRKRTFGMAMATIIAAGINLFLNYIFIPRLGYLAAAYTTLVGFISLLIIHMYLVKRMGLETVYNSKLVVAVMIIGVFVSIGITIIYRYYFIRYTVLLTYCCITIALIYKYRKAFLILLKKLS